MDILIALTIMVLLLTFVSRFSLQRTQTPVADDAATLAAVMHSPYPEYWNETSVISPGIVRDGRLDKGLLDNFSALDEDKVRSLTGITTEFALDIYSPKGPIATAGTPNPPDAEFISIVRRFAAYNGTIATIEVIAWQ